MSCAYWRRSSRRYYTFPLATCVRTPRQRHVPSRETVPHDGSRLKVTTSIPRCCETSSNLPATVTAQLGASYDTMAREPPASAASVLAHRGRSGKGCVVITALQHPAIHTAISPLLTANNRELLEHSNSLHLPLITHTHTQIGRASCRERVSSPV